MSEQHIYTVSEYNDFLKGHLQESVGLVVIQGEVSGMKVARDTMIFFDLKDRDASMGCFCMAWELHANIADGMEIRVLGFPSVFKRSGKLHLRVQAVELVGHGALQRAFEALKAKLQEEGLFADERKRRLPRFPETVGLVTSLGAAAYTDVKQKLSLRWPLARIVFAPVAVQGIGAAKQITQAIEMLNRDGRADVLIVTRGGGSLEDLQAFNDERVARAIFGSAIPVISGVGHERDWTIADLVADQRATTPTNAAELAVPDERDVAQILDDTLQHMDGELRHAIRRNHDALRLRVQTMETAITWPVRKSVELRSNFFGLFRLWYHSYEGQRRSLPLLTTRLNSAFHVLRDRVADGLRHMSRLLVTLSPRATLKRGYSITRSGGRILSSVKHIRLGDELTTEVSDGTISSTTHL